MCLVAVGVMLSWVAGTWCCSVGDECSDGLVNGVVTCSDLAVEVGGVGCGGAISAGVD